MLKLYGWYAATDMTTRRGKKRRLGREERGPQAKAAILESAVTSFTNRVGFPPTNLVIRVHANTEMSRRSSTLKRLNLSMCVAPCYVGPSTARAFVQNPPRSHFFLWAEDVPSE